MTRRAWALFLLMSLLWGIPYLLIKVALQELSPVALVFLRTLLAALLLLPLAWRRGALAGLRPVLPAILALTLTEVTVPFLLIAGGETHITSSLTGLLISSEPLMIALLAIWLDASERVAGRRLAGLVVGIVGVALLLGVQAAGDSLRLLGAAMVLVATLCYAFGVLMVKLWFGGRSQLGVAALTVTANTVLMAPLALAGLPHRAPSPAVLGAVLVLGFACTALAFVAYFSLIREAGAGRATVVTYVNPAIAVALGVLILGEPFGAVTGAGFLLIVAGSYLATRGGPPAREVPEPAARAG